MTFSLYSLNICWMAKAESCGGEVLLASLSERLALLLLDGGMLVGSGGVWERLLDYVESVLGLGKKDLLSGFWIRVVLN
jgi:hypothetical protein